METTENVLQEYIRERMGELRITSWAELGRRAGLPRATIYALATQPRRDLPKAGTLERIARALEVPVSLLRAKAYESIGYRYSEHEITAAGERMQLLVTSLEELDESDIAEIEALVDAKLRNRSPERQRSS